MNAANVIEQFSALAHEGRLGLFRQLVVAGREGLPAGELASRAGVNFTTASAQLGVLSQAGLVRRERRGRSIFYFAEFAAMAGLIRFLMEDCCGGSQALLEQAPEAAELLGSCIPNIKPV